MADLSLTFEVEGEEVLIKNFRQVAATIEDLTDAFRATQVEFRNAESDNFQSENSSGKSGKWKPLSKAYEKQKIAKYGTFALLAGVEIASEKLYKSLTGETADTVTRIDKREAAFGTSLPYAKAQHFGYSPRNLPSRPLIDLSDLQLKRMGDAMRKEIVGQVKRRTTLILNDSNFGDIG